MIYKPVLGVCLVKNWDCGNIAFSDELEFFHIFGKMLRKKLQHELAHYVTLTEIFDERTKTPLYWELEIRSSGQRAYEMYIVTPREKSNQDQAWQDVVAMRHYAASKRQLLLLNVFKEGEEDL